MGLISNRSFRLLRRCWLFRRLTLSAKAPKIHMEPSKKRERQLSELDEPFTCAKKQKLSAAQLAIEESKARMEKMKEQIAAKKQEQEDLYAVSELMKKPVDNIEDCKKAVARLRKCDCISVDGEWSGRGREAKLCLLQVSFPLDESNEVGVYLFDAFVGGKAMFEEGGLKDLLEDAKFLKVLHDCRLDADVLLHSFGVKLTNVIDTQVLYYFNFIQLQNYSPLPVSLRTLLRKYAAKEDSSLKQEAHELMNTNPLFWEVRPMTPLMIQYAREDVLYLLHAYRRLWSGLDPRNHELAISTCKQYLNQVRSMPEFPHERYSGSSLPSYGIDSWDKMARSHWEFLNAKYPNRFKSNANSETPDNKEMKAIQAEKFAETNAQPSVPTEKPPSKITASAPKAPKNLFLSSDKPRKPFTPKAASSSAPSVIPIYGANELPEFKKFGY